jgi:hypothetical protein
MEKGKIVPAYREGHLLRSVAKFSAEGDVYALAFFLYWEGVMLVCFLKAALKTDLELNPTS